jgi:hypothetical protein
MTASELPPAATEPGIGRMLLALAVAGTALAAICALLAWGVYALNFTDDDYGVASRASFAAYALGGGLAVFSFTAGPLALIALRVANKRSAAAFALAGAVAGPAFVLAVSAVTDAPAPPAAMIVFAILGALHLLITRKAAGIRARR